MQPKRLQLRERVAFIHEFVLPNSNNTAEMQPYEPNQAKKRCSVQIKKAADIFLVKKAKMRYTIYTCGHTKL